MTRHLLSSLVKMERAMRLELTNIGFAIRCLSRLATRAISGTEGEIRTLESSLEDSHVSSYITSANARAGAARAGSGVRTFDFEMELLAGLEPAASTFEASRSSNLSYRSKNLVGEDRV